MRVLILGGCTGSVPDDEWPAVKAACARIGADLCRASHEIVVCSPFEDSADYSALAGAAGTKSKLKAWIHFPNTPTIRAAVEALGENLGHESITPYPHSPPETEDSAAVRYAWLLCQLRAMDECHMVSTGTENRAYPVNSALDDRLGRCAGGMARSRFFRLAG